MVAEAESPKLHTWFDATYGWQLHHLLNDIAQGKRGTDTLTAFFAHQQALFGDSAYRLNFTSNHDENSWNGSEFERMKANHIPAYVLSATVKNSMPLLYSGQEASQQKRLKFFDKDTIDWSGPSLAPFYTRRSGTESGVAHRVRLPPTAVIACTRFHASARPVR